MNLVFAARGRFGLLTRGPARVDRRQIPARARNRALRGHPGRRQLSIGVCALGLLAAVQTACNLDNPGFSPPPGRITYPIGLALSEETTESGAPRYLYVANSNYDLRYNAGSVHAYDLEALVSAIEANNCREYVPPPVDFDAGEEDAEVDAGEDAEVDAGEDADLDGGEDAALDADEDAELEGGQDAELDAADGAAQDADLDASGDSDAGPGDAGVADARLPEVTSDAQVAAPRDTKRGILCDGRNTRSDDETVCCFGAPSALDKFRTSEVLTDSYASGITLAPGGAHLYVPIRGITRLLYLDVDGGDLSCGGQTGRCERGPKLGAEAQTEDRTFPAQPTSIVSGHFAELGNTTEPDSTFVATLHERGAVSLFRTKDSGEPQLVDTLNTLGTRAVSLSKDDSSGLLFLSSTIAQSVLRIGLRTLPNAGPDDPPHLYQASSVLINGLSTAADIRDVLSDLRPRRPGEPERVFALLRGGVVPTTNFIQSLVFLDLVGEGDGRYARVVDALRLGIGPSKLERIILGGRQLILASCYDEGSIYIIDADVRRIVTVVREFSGPFSLRADPRRQLLYVADFRASVLRVVDLHGLIDESAELPRIVATLGTPTYQGGIR
jgi:hypothetical protein